MFPKPTFHIFCFIIFITSPLSLRAAGDGNTAGEFLKFTSSARTLALGDTFAALPHGGFSLAENPAGLGESRHAEASLMTSQRLEDSTHHAGIFSIPFKRAGTWAVGVHRFGIDPFDAYDDDNLPTGKVESESQSAALGWGKSFQPKNLLRGNFSVGLAAKRVSEKVAGVTASATAIDAGVLYRPRRALSVTRHDWLKRVAFGLAVRNNGSDLSFDRDASPLPREVVTGLSYAHFMGGNAITLAADYRSVKGEDATASAGVELWHRDLLALRAGYSTKEELSAPISAGAGFRFQGFELDYAWAPQSSALGDVHRVSLSYKFGLKDAFPSSLADDFFAYYIQQGDDAMTLGNFDQAILFYNKALHINPSDKSVQNKLLIAGEKMGAGQ